MIEKLKQLTISQKIKLAIAIILILLTIWQLTPDLSNKKPNVPPKPNPVDDIMQMDTSDIRPELSVQDELTLESDLSTPELDKNIENNKVEPLIAKTKNESPKEVIHLDDDAANFVHYSTQLKIQTVRQKALEAQMNADKIALEKAESEKYGSQPKLKGSYVLPPVPNEKPVNLDASNYKPSFIDDMRVASLVGVGGNIEAVISFQNQLIPIKVGSKIGDITITNITPSAVTFKENGKTKTKWVSSIPAPLPDKEDK